MGGIATVPQGVTLTNQVDKTEETLRRVELLLKDIQRNGNHGEISIRVIAGRVRITGGAEVEIK
jgi:hypothetical protein